MAFGFPRQRHSPKVRLGHKRKPLGADPLARFHVAIKIYRRALRGVLNILVGSFWHAEGLQVP